MYTIFTNNQKLIEAARSNGDTVICPNSSSSYLVDANLNSMITRFLTRILNIPVHIRGYSYIKAIFVKSIETPGFEKEPITKVVYPFCAGIFNATPSRIERCVRHAINVSYQRSKQEDYFDLFGISDNVPTNKRFIVTTINYFKENYLK